MLTKVDFPPVRIGTYLATDKKMMNCVSSILLSDNARPKGKFIISFTLDKNGIASNYKIENSLRPSLDDKLIRCLEKTQDNWSPAILNKSTVSTIVKVPISIR
jgi:hypothetical protein